MTKSSLDEKRAGCGRSTRVLCAKKEDFSREDGTTQTAFPPVISSFAFRNSHYFTI
eukprot:m.271316 g.271316  ORF g.271316 m.271316 type:complete len:56 (-) comp16090_c0_seq2:2248-2415(-)